MSPSRIILVHGFTGTARSWDGVSGQLAPGLDVVAVDLPGHGRAAQTRLAFPDAAAWIGEKGGRGTYAGYSMGGRLCLRLALDRPDLVTNLVLIGTSPGLASLDERAARRESDERLAATIERDGTEKFLQRWLSHPLFATFDPSPEELAQRAQNPADALASALRLLGPGSQDPLWDRLGELKMPVLVMVGERDTKYLGIAKRMIDSGLHRAVVAVVPGSGHAVHLESPDACADLIREFVHERSS